MEPEIKIHAAEQLFLFTMRNRKQNKTKTQLNLYNALYSSLAYNIQVVCFDYKMCYVKFDHLTVFICAKHFVGAVFLNSVMLEFEYFYHCDDSALLPRAFSYTVI